MAQKNKNSSSFNDNMKTNLSNFHDTESQQHSLEEKELITWNIKTIASSPKDTERTQLYVIFAAVVVFLYFTWLLSDSLPKELNYLILVGLGLAGFSLYLILLIVRQKTDFNYRITTNGGETTYKLYYKNFAGAFFKTITAFTFLLFLSVSFYTGSLLFLIGPVAIALGAAKSLLGWKNEIKHEKSLPWNEYNFVTIDRKRLMVITHRTDLTLGFEARFPNEELLEKYLKILHSVLPTTAEFSERRWEW